MEINGEKKHYHPKNTLGFRSKSISCGEKTTLNRVDIHAVWASGSRVAIASAAHGGGGEHNRLLVELKKTESWLPNLKSPQICSEHRTRWMDECGFHQAEKLQFPRSKKTISIRETSLTSKELWSVQKVKNQHGWVSMSLLLHSLFCTVSKLENGLRFQRRGARKWAPISVILAKPSNMAILVSTPIGPFKRIEYPNTPHEIPYVQIGAGCRLMPQKGWGPTSERLSSFFVLFGTDKIYLHRVSLPGVWIYEFTS